MALIIRMLQRWHCPHHGSFCHGRACCCRDRHWKGISNHGKEGK